MKTQQRKTPGSHNKREKHAAYPSERPGRAKVATEVDPVRRKQLEDAMIAAGRWWSECWSRCEADPYDDAAFVALDSAEKAYDKAIKAADPEHYAEWLLLGQQSEAAYPKGFWRALWQLKRGDANALELPVRFLEQDPWVFRSGYEKADIIRYINRLPLPEHYQKRLQQVVLNVIDKKRDRREFRSYCRLARKVDPPELRAELEKRLGHANSIVRRQARWALEACLKPA